MADRLDDPYVETSIVWQEISDAELVDLCLSGHDMAWATLLDRYSRLIYSVPLRYGLPQSLADEIFQETCLVALEKLDTLRDVTRLGGWLATTAKRLCMGHWRRNDKMQFVELDETHDRGNGELVEKDILALEQQNLVQQAMSHLPERDQKLLKALYMDDPPRTYDWVSAELGIPKGSIGPTRARSLKKLQKELVKLEGLLAIS